MEQNSPGEPAAPAEEPAESTSAAAPTPEPKQLKRGRQTHCFAPGCKSGKNSRRRDPDGRHYSLFRMPRNEEMFRRWQRYMPPRNDGKKLKPESALCERHFDPQFIMRYFEHYIQGDVVRIPRGKPILTPDAVPTVFPESPKYYTRRVPRRRKPPRRVPLPPPKPKHTKATDTASVTTDDGVNGTSAAADVEPTPEQGRQEMAAEPSVDTVPDSCVEQIVECEVTPAFPYEDLPLPSRQWARHVISEKPLVLAYSTCRVCDDVPGRLETEKLVLVHEYEDHAECRVYLDGRRLHNFEGVGGTDYPWTLLERLDQVKRCPGFGDTEQFPSAAEQPFVELRGTRLHSVECAGASNPRGGMSDKCHLVKSRLRRRQLRMERRRRARNAAAREPQAVIVKLTEAPSPGGEPGQLVMVEGQEDIAADFVVSVSNEVVAEEVVFDKTESSCSDSIASKNDGSPSATQLEGTGGAVPYETVISRPAPIYVI